MRYLDRVIAGGDTLYVRHEGEWTPWIVSDWRGGPEPAIFGRREGGPYERLPAGAVHEVPVYRHAPPRNPGPNYDTYGSWSLGPPKPRPAPLLADLERQNTARLSDENGNISFATEAAHADKVSSAIFVMPSHRRR